MTEHTWTIENDILSYKETFSTPEDALKAVNGLIARTYKTKPEAIVVVVSISPNEDGTHKALCEIYLGGENAS